MRTVKKTRLAILAAVAFGVIAAWGSARVPEHAKKSLAAISDRLSSPQLTARIPSHSPTSQAGRPACGNEPRPAGSVPSIPSPQSEPLSLTCIANSGAMVAAGESKVLVDALFDRPNPHYRAPAPGVLDKLLKDEAPFDGVDLVLVTHNHPDHFDAGLAARFMEALPGPILVAPSDAVAEMRKAAATWASIAPRIVPIDLEVGQKETREVKGIPLTAFRTLHSGDNASPMNIMYLFEIGGRRVFHEGDSNGKPDVYRAFGLGDAPIDLALVHYWFPFDPECAAFLQETLRPEHIALTHLPIANESDAPGKVEQVRRYYKDIILLLFGMPPTVIHD